MLYATFADLARVAPGGWLELAQRAGCGPLVGAALFEAVATGGELDAWPADQVADATRGVSLLLDTLERTSRHADTYIVPRYGQRLSPELVAGSDLPTVVATIALRRLYGHAATEDMRRATDWADKYLADLAAGRASLGTADVQDNDPETRWDFSARRASDDALGGYR